MEGKLCTSEIRRLVSLLLCKQTLPPVFIILPFFGCLLASAVAVKPHRMNPAGAKQGEWPQMHCSKEYQHRGSLAASSCPDLCTGRVRAPAAVPVSFRCEETLSSAQHPVPQSLLPAMTSLHPQTNFKDFSFFCNNHSRTRDFLHVSPAASRVSACFPGWGMLSSGKIQEFSWLWRRGPLATESWPWLSFCAVHKDSHSLPTAEGPRRTLRASLCVGQRSQLTGRGLQNTFFALPQESRISFLVGNWHLKCRDKSDNPLGFGKITSLILQCQHQIHLGLKEGVTSVIHLASNGIPLLILFIAHQKTFQTQPERSTQNFLAKNKESKVFFKRRIANNEETHSWLI